MGCIIVSELLMLTIILLWPIDKTEKIYQDIVFSDGEFEIEEIQITSQKSTPPPPPIPQIPIPVPNDRVIEEEIFIPEELDQFPLPDPIAMQGIGRLGSDNRVAANPQLPPSVVRIVEPTVPSAAKKADVKAEIWVSFLVDEEGLVQEATISRIKLFDKNEKSFKIVGHIEYGLSEATLEAALKWKFRPAKNDGKIVKAYTKHIFTYGF